jgi:prefoldin subunit 5
MNSSDISSEGVVAPNSAEGSGAIVDAQAHPAADAAPAAAESVAPTVPPTAESAELAAPTVKSESDAAPAKALPVNAHSDGAKSSAKPAGVSLIPFVAPPRAEAPPPPKRVPLWRVAFEKRLQIGAVAAGLAAVGTVAAAAVSYKSAQEQSVAVQYSETQNLAETMSALKGRLAAMETAKHDEIAELRKTVADLKSGLASAREANGAVAQVNARAEKLEKDQAAKRDEIADLRKTIAELKSSLAIGHDSTAALAQVNVRTDKLEHDQDARIEKLGERIDRDAAARNADITARLEKLEKKVASAAPAVAAAAPQPATPAAASTPPTPPVLPKQATQLPPVAANVSKETTGSIPTPQTPIRGWIVREAHGNVALVEGPYGFRQIGPGDVLPGAGRVERIERRGNGWAVVTDRGVINSAYGGSGSGYYRLGGYGAFNGAYGPPDGEF